MADPDMRTGIVPGGNHALLIGEVLGALINAGIDATPVKDDNDYTNEIRVMRPNGTYIVAVYPEVEIPD